ncbi:MAG: stage II sporulation protein R [Angelakisella sp.]
MLSKETRLDTVLILALTLAILLTPLVRFGQQCQQLQTQVLRLHILANSDSAEDQRVKLAVRDAVLAGTQELFATAPTLDAAEQAARASLARIERLAADELTRQGKPPLVTARVKNLYFTTRSYPGAILPAGRYDAVQLTIGTGGGKNWWCVVFPPLCVEAAVKEKTPLTQRVERLGKRPDYKLAFASVELIQGLWEKLSRP